MAAAPSPSPKRQKQALSAETPEELIGILDAGAQYGKVIDRRVRQLQVASVMLPLDTPPDKLTHLKGIIISGGPQSVYGADAPKYHKELFDLGIPILGICYGMQLMSLVLGGRVEKKTTREDGQFRISIQEKSDLFEGISTSTEVLLTHGDSVVAPAPNFKVTAVSQAGIITAVEDASRKLYGVQFHPEVDLTVEGETLLSNFLFRICGFTPSFTLSSRREKAIQAIQAAVGDRHVLVLVSGGVDSTVCAALLKAALKKEQIYAVHVDNGFMRQHESQKVCKALEAIGLAVHFIDASQQFYNATTEIDGRRTVKLCETVSPEEKRKIIGDTFMHVSDQKVREFKLDPEHTLLAQGTLRPDLIESASRLASSNASVIKTHHNDTQLVRLLRDKGRIVEPLADYHKDEVRLLGEELGLPHHLVWRQPFPGPGLAIRIICADEPFVTAQDAHIVESLKSYTTATVQATLLPCRTVGVQGDARTYSSLVALSGHEPPCWPELLGIAKELPKKVHGVNRVVYAFGPRLPAGALASITPTRLTPDVIGQLQAADDIVNQTLVKYDLVRALSQVPAILFPVDFGVAGARAVCVRTFITNDFMTGVPAVPGSKELPSEALLEMVARILEEVPGIARVCYDLTAKPPATTEWE